MNWSRYNKFWLAAIPSIVGLVDQFWVGQGEPWVSAVMFVLSPLLVLLGPANRA